MNIFQVLIPSAILALSTPAAPWSQPLSHMPMDPAETINRTNCIERLLTAFQPGPEVKALIFLPGVANNFYLLQQNNNWTFQAGNLYEAIVTLTNRTQLQATFNPPFLLLHTKRDSLQPRFTIKSKTKTERLKSTPHPARLYIDRHWSSIQPELQNAFTTRTRPAPNSDQAWHFARHNLSFNHLSCWDALRAVSLAGETTVSIHRFSVRFGRSSWETP